MDGRDDLDGLEEGWVRLWRKALSSRVFEDPWLWKLWCWCLLRADWKARWKHGRETTVGSFCTDYRQAAEQLNTTINRCHRGLHRLQEWGQIRLKAERRFTVVTICNWETYQPDKEVPQNTDRTQTERKQNADRTPSLREEGEEIKEGEEVRARPRRQCFVKPTVAEVAAYCRARGNRIDPALFVDTYEARGWVVGTAGTPMRDWKAAVRTWERNEGRFERNGHNGRASAAQRTAQNLAEGGFLGGLCDDEGGVRADPRLSLLGGEQGDAAGAD